MSGKILNLINGKRLDTTIDFYVQEYNGVRGVYAVSPRILLLDEPKLWGIPFIFYVGAGQRIDSLPARLLNTDREVIELRQKGVPYLTPEQYNELVRGMRIGFNVPKIVHMTDQSIPIEELVRVGYVPYSFGVHHENDILRKTKVRGQGDYDKMLNEILPEIR